MLTKNEKNVLRLLLSLAGEDYSINNIAKECKLSPNGAFKILKKLEKEGVLKTARIANIKSYKINFGNEKTYPMLEWVLIPKLEGRIKHRYDDLKEMQDITKCCIMFGSYTDLSKNPNDLDLLFVLDKNRYKEFSKKISGLKEVMPANVHDTVQTEKDMEENIKKKDKVVIEILRKGVVLWGQNTLIQVIKNAYKG